MNHRIISFLFSCLLLLSFSLKAQNQTPIAAGQVYDSIACKKHPGHTYALFLPPDYDSLSSYPVIFIFEPGARGLLPIDSFRYAAATYGYILASSHKLRNGPWEDILGAANEMMEDVQLRFPIDSNRIYTSGFSGGSRAALAVAALNDDIAGVIGCGAALPPPTKFRPKTGDQFVYIGLVGDRDMNYLEMHELENNLLELGIPTCLRIFPAGHTWPPPSVIHGAVGWLELQAMKKGNLPMDQPWLDTQFEQMASRARELQKAEDWIEANRYYQYLKRDFPQHLRLAALQEEGEQLLDAKGYKKAQKLWDKNKVHEETEKEMFLKAFDKIVFSQHMPDSVRSWWKQEINQLKTASKSKKQDKSLMAFRLLNILHATCIEWGQGRMAMNQYATAARFYDIWGLIQAQSKFPFYLQARAYALDRNTIAAYKALGKAIKLGFSRPDSIRADPAFSKMLEEDRFQALLKSME